MPKSKTDFTNFIDARPNYFPGQYLLEDDFETQQNYLINRQKYHRQSLYVSGIIEGLEIELIKDKQEVLIKSGSATNSNGDLIILKNDISFSKFTNLPVGELYISYKEEQQIKQQESFTRWQEVPTISFAATTPNDGVKLAKISIVNNVPNLDLTVRSYSAIFLPNAGGNDLTLRSGGNANPNLAILNGSLTVTGTFTVNNKVTVLGNQKIEFSDTNLTNNLKLQLWTGYGLGINDGTLFYAANSKHSWRDNNGTNERMVLTTGVDGFLTVNGTGTSSFAGNLRVTGTITGNINATNINAGVLDIARIPDLPPNKIASGTLTADRIPNLSADKITTGTATGNLTIGGNLTVTGAINPSVGNSESNGIMFPKDPGGGGGDAAWIRYYSRNPNSTELTIKEQTTLEIGTSNDFNDHIALMPGAGNVGVGTITPTAKLEINGTLMNKMDLIETGQRSDWNSNTHPIKVYFKDRLTGKPVGTWIRAIQNHNSWRGHYWDGWVDADGAIRVIHNHNNTAATTANNSGAS
jgi:hypothetical protein